MLKIRLSRRGRKNLPYYVIVVAEVTSSRDGKFIEKIGTYDPLLDNKSEKRLVLNKERAEYWLSVGAKPTDRVASFLSSLGVKDAKKYEVKYTTKAKGDGAKKKALERMKKEQEQSAAQAAESETTTEAAS
jgi:small subunit ribosomal protein S16